MAPHLWIFPSIALGVALLSLVLSLWWGAGGPLRLKGPGRSYWAAWLLSLASALWMARRLETAAGIAPIASRGILLGYLCGALMALVILGLGGQSMDPASKTSHRRAYLAPALFSLGTLTAAAGRLWLSHAEITGLGCTSLGVLLTLLCLITAPAILDRKLSPPRDETPALASLLAFLYVVCLASTVALGFTRAKSLNEMYWPDVPLLLGGALCVGSLLNSAMVGELPVGSLVPALPAVLIALVSAIPLSKSLTGTWRPLETIALGIVTFAVLRAVSGRSVLTSAEGIESPVDDAGAMAGFLLLAGVSALAFVLWSGYGLGMVSLGACFVVGWSALQSNPRAPALIPDATSVSKPTQRPMADLFGLSFLAVLLVHRLLLLQTGSGIRLPGPGDTWDLFGMGVGALIPAAIAASMLASTPVWMGMDWARVIEWLFALALAVFLIDYVWGPRAVAAVLLGAAIVQLVNGASRGALRASAIIATSLIFCLSLTLVLPIFHEMQAPTRHDRALAGIFCAAIIAARLLLSLLPIRREKS